MNANQLPQISLQQLTIKNHYQRKRARSSHVAIFDDLAPYVHPNGKEKLKNFQHGDGNLKRNQYTIWNFLKV